MSYQTDSCKVQLWAGHDIEVNEDEHPNKATFTGTLLYLDEPSQQPPHGSDGHKIYVSKEVAKKTAPSLIGMAVDFEPDLEGHDPKRKIGLIESAWVDGNKLKVKGTIWKKDFPEALRAFRQNRGLMGMSAEFGNVYIRDKDEDVWHLEDFHFTGAAILKKAHAAYNKTELAASRQHFVNALAAATAAEGIFINGGESMAKEVQKKKVAPNGQAPSQNLASIMSAAIKDGLKAGFAGVLAKQEETDKKLTSVLAEVAKSQKELVNGLQAMASAQVEAATEEIEAEAEETEEIEAEAEEDVDVDAEEEEIEAAGKKPADEDEDEEEEMEDEEDDGDEGEYEAEADPSAASDPTSYSAPEFSDSEPGHLNKDADSLAKSKSRSGSTQMKPGGDSKNPGIVAGKEKKIVVKKPKVVEISAAAKVIRTLRAERDQFREENSRLQNRLSAMEASLERYADKVERRSVTPEIQALLEKSGYDVRELITSKQRLSVGEVDNMFASSGFQLEPQMRAAFKNQLLQLGIMEDGRVNRYNQ